MSVDLAGDGAQSRRSAEHHSVGDQTESPTGAEPVAPQGANHVTTINTTPDDDIVWEDPPPPNRGSAAAPVMENFREALRSRAGTWARWPNKLAKATAYSTASEINTGRRPKFTEGFEAAARKIEDGTTVLFVRYVGED